MHIERFAPSPTGRLHLGHAYSALVGYNAAKDAGGQWLLRIEDIDFQRSKPEFTQAIYDDLRWLGLNWPTPVLVQSERRAAYDAALSQLQSRGLIYGCECTRGDIKAALSARNEGDLVHPPYPGTCRDKNLIGADLTWRLDMEKALRDLGSLSYREIGQGRDEWRSVTAKDLHAHGDIVLARRDIGTSYHLAVVVDDAFQKITHVTRGADMERETPIHVLLQKLLEYSTPIYRHHALIRDENGKRLAKRDDARSISYYRDQGMSSQDLNLLIKKSL